MSLMLSLMSYQGVGPAVTWGRALGPWAIWRAACIPRRFCPLPARDHDHTGHLPLGLAREQSRNKNWD